MCSSGTFFNNSSNFLFSSFKINTFSTLLSFIIYIISHFVSFLIFFFLFLKVIPVVYIFFFVFIVLMSTVLLFRILFIIYNNAVVIKIGNTEKIVLGPGIAFQKSKKDIINDIF